jgi:2-polyprenyl-3-methyl-5-hydroxy-6-metoxy-1,4-benzoquinol methylase
VGLDERLDETAEPTDAARRRDDHAVPPSATSAETQIAYRPHSAALYATEIDPSVEVGAHSIVLRMVGSDKRVLELGCAQGSMTKVFAQRGCRVTCVEIDADAAQLAKEWADEVIVGDLDTMDVSAALGDARFDVIVAADVLEHLRDPRRVLDACLEHLDRNGEVVLSIPNIAHGDLRLALLQGEFEYRQVGLLDETHLRFFTRQSLERFLADSDLVVLEWDRTTIPVGDTEIPWHPSVDQETLNWVMAQADADTYQFVLRATSAREDPHLHEVADQRDALRAENSYLAVAVRPLESENSRLRAEVEAARSMAASFKIAEIERDDYRASFEQLADIEDQLVAVRRSVSYRLGRLLITPLVTARRMLRAWRLARR